MSSFDGVISLGPWGVPRVDHWRFRASNGITEITINVDSNVKAISFRDDQGYISGTFGGRNPSDLGVQNKIEIGWPSEYLKTISGTHGNYVGQNVITSLTFTTNLKTYGPYGKTTGDEFSIPVADSAVVGFHGSSDNYINSIGVFVQPAISNGSISLGPWGGSGGHPFSFKAASWIKEINIFEGPCIYSFVFKDANGNEYGKFGGGDPNEQGTKQTIEIDGPSEHLTSITGTYGMYKAGTPVITSLSFITNRTTHGPFGTASGTSFSIPIDGSFVNGFFGSTGYYVDAVGIFVKPTTTT